MTNYKKLEAWQSSLVLVKGVYKLTIGFPKDEVYGLSSQIKRAAVSIPANIAEGMGRRFKRDTAHFLTIARGSAYEVETLIQIAEMNAMVNAAEVVVLEEQLSETLKILNGLIKYFDSDENLKG